ncbi:hypothetical protein HPT25_23850 [Bacillus sp. BRMEA1]|uniref:hypothetical protein n=1 Tax=Neobacillus endophyticus TaxID=2738405 RepID=UPI001564BA56|nr:hypothetical protein [Neobacillus endophyticus]NRD80359.1 hypothetical protein [Neobacillus endophyticus]
MELNYESAQRLKGEIIKYKNNEGIWVIGRVVKVRKDGLEIEELKASIPSDGHGFGFWGPCWGPPAFIPFVAFGVAFPFFW